jgi:hypothetical protein
MCSSHPSFVSPFDWVQLEKNCFQVEQVSYRLLNKFGTHRIVALENANLEFSEISAFSSSVKVMTIVRVGALWLMVTT